MQNDAGDMVDLCARPPPPSPALPRAPGGGAPPCCAAGRSKTAAPSEPISRRAPDVAKLTDGRHALCRR